jgi:thiol:disulfide interchange protein DsbD
LRKVREHEEAKEDLVTSLVFKTSGSVPPSGGFDSHPPPPIRSRTPLSATHRERTNKVEAETLPRLVLLATLLARRSHPQSGARAARSGVLTAAGVLGMLIVAVLLCASLPAGAQTPKVLPPQQAFPYSLSATGEHVVLRFDIPDGYYLYRNRFGFSSTTPGITLGSAEFPAGESHSDEFFGKQVIYRRQFEIRVPYQRASGMQRMGFALKLQGCADVGLCYPPQNWNTELNLPAGVAAAAGGGSGEGTGADVRERTAGGAEPERRQVSEQDRFTSVILDGSLWALLGVFYVAGLLLSFTPCVLPMVPILSSIIVGQGAAVSAWRGFSLSVAYVLGMALTYTGAGALAALAGGQIQAAFQKPWIIVLFAALFSVLALGMFGAFNLQMPSAIQSRIAGLANQQKAGTYVGTVAMGALTALIVTTCVAPALVGALAVIGQQGDVARGATALFALSLGMGSPLLVMGASAGHVLPKVGPWMNAVKGVFGVMLLGVAIWLLERVLPGGSTLALWALLVFLSGVFLGAFEPLPQGPTPASRLAKGVGLLACLYGALLLIGATLGGENPLKPIPRTLLGAGSNARAEEALGFQSIESVAELESALKAARVESRPVIVDFAAEWCVSCKEMEAYTFPDPSVIAALAPFVLLRADVTANDADDKALLQFFASFGPPTIAFFDARGNEQRDFKLVGYVPPADFAAHVARVAAL